jgi:hypothetical protein
MTRFWNWKNDDDYDDDDDEKTGNVLNIVIYDNRYNDDE